MLNQKINHVSQDQSDCKMSNVLLLFHAGYAYVHILPCNAKFSSKVYKCIYQWFVCTSSMIAAKF